MKEPRNKKSSVTTDLNIPGVEIGQLEKLLDFMASHGLEEFEYEHAGLRIRLRKAPGVVTAAPRPEIPHPSNPGSFHAPATVPHSAEPAPAASAAPAAEDLHVVKSPIVGTFYSAASPGSAPFVKVGDTIQVGQVVCIIEAMKLMNEIEADVSGEVVRSLVENGQPVEYGQALFAIRAAKKK
jgi:acetyl-CoA carboxylase biotin carboxyl carrier protein